MPIQMTYIDVQQHAAARAIADDDLCASCKHCAFCPGDKSICTLMLDGSDCHGTIDEDGYVYECPSFDMIDHQDALCQENWVDPVSILVESEILSGGAQHVLLSYMEAVLENLIPDFNGEQSRCLAKWTTLQVFNGKQINIPLYPESQMLTFVLDHKDFTISLRTLSVIALTIIAQQDMLAPEMLNETGVSEDEFNHILRVITLSAHFIEQGPLVSLTAAILETEAAD